MASAVFTAALFSPSLAAQTKPPDKKNAVNKFEFLVPEDFSGWVCVDFGVVGAPPLPREGDAGIVRPVASVALNTSDITNQFVLYGSAWYEVNGMRKPMPKNVEVHVGLSEGEGNNVVRHCAYIGTADQLNAAADPPGFDVAGTRRRVKLPNEEIDALTALYNSTNGIHWHHNVGWPNLTANGCQLHGVDCDDSHVFRLALEFNNLSGILPDELRNLSDLESLDLYGNNVTGLLPKEMIDKWLAGNLEIISPPSAVTGITEIDFESDPSMLLCGRKRIILNSNQEVTSYQVECRKATLKDRRTFCEVKTGKIRPMAFGKLGAFMERSDFFSLEHEY